jgi:hypothetical protein
MKKSVMRFARVFCVLVCGTILYTPVFSQYEEENGRAERAADFRGNVMVTATVPIMMSNRIQREAFRGLIGTEVTNNILVGKGVHIGFGGQYNVFQTRSPNDFKIKNRDILQHHITPGISLGYETRIKSDQRFSFYPSVFAGYSFVYFSGLLTGVDTSFYPNPQRSFLSSGITVSPQLAFFMSMNDEYNSVVGFTIGVNILTYEMKKAHIYLEKIVNGDGVTDDAYFINVPDNGITSYFKIGFVFLQRYKKLKNKLPN